MDSATEAALEITPAAAIKVVFVYPMDELKQNAAVWAAGVAPPGFPEVVIGYKVYPQAHAVHVT